ncbi:metallophosphoesterase [Limnohabitans sp.]|uniref:metallophosphoesterase n=1 Tax=Limnohabitans sp. TaxID=1907725 RepID=UPI0035AD92FD
MGFDVIGDVHGQVGKLEALLQKLGYVPQGRGYKAPVGRQALFLGDMIDRGPGQIRVLEIVRSMVDSGQALCIMGNHEFNAIAYVVDDPWNPGESMRPSRSESPQALKNRQQHAEFLAQVGEGSQDHRAWVEWFRSLPVCLDLGGIRAVHGCWDEDAVRLLAQAGWQDGSSLTDELLYQVGRHLPREQESALVRARKLLTCGLELPLPAGRFILDKAGHRHAEVRIANWRDGAEQFHQVALVPPGQEAQLAGMDWPAELVISAIEGSPIFVSHHWFTGHPKIEGPKLACLDWSAAREGPLVAYRWDGEDDLSNDNLIWSH